MDDLVADLAVDIAVSRRHDDQGVQSPRAAVAGEASLVIHVLFHSQLLRLENRSVTPTHDVKKFEAR